MMMGEALRRRIEPGVCAVTNHAERPSAGTALRDRADVELPRHYKVLLHNDDYTTMDFVVWVLEEIFMQPHEDAVRIMYHVHEHGLGVAGVYIKAVAETKAARVHTIARDRGFPLRCSIEPE